MRGIVDRLGDYALDAARVHPAVAAFFEDTTGYVLDIRSHWRGPMLVVWVMWRWLFVLAGQFVLPIRRARIVTRGFPLAQDVTRPPRPGARAIIREYEGGGAMQAVAYAVWNGHMSAVFPLPVGHLAGVLRAENVERGVRLTATGVWFVLFGLRMRTPFGETLSLWPDDTGAGALGRHEQRLFGVRFVTHDYRFTSASAARPSAR